MTGGRVAPGVVGGIEEDGNCRVCRAVGVARPFMEVERRSYRRCDRCEATYVARADLPNGEREFTHYLSHENDPGDARYRRFLSKLSEPLLARLSPNSCGLDYGCGPGPALAQMMVEAGHQVRLYDPFFSPTLGDPAEAGVGSRDPLSGSYDFITCSEVAEHFHDPAQEFAKLDCLLRPGGWLGVMTCFQDDDERFAAWHYRKDPTHVVFYRAATFERLAADFGWSCEIVAKDIVLMRKGT